MPICLPLDTSVREVIVRSLVFFLASFHSEQPRTVVPGAEAAIGKSRTVPFRTSVQGSARGEQKHLQKWQSTRNGTAVLFVDTAGTQLGPKSVLRRSLTKLCESRCNCAHIEIEQRTVEVELDSPETW
jgi:hypothetical protein